jgi:hypothetical protein
MIHSVEDEQPAEEQAAGQEEDRGQVAVPGREMTSDEKPDRCTNRESLTYARPVVNNAAAARRMIRGWGDVVCETVSIK